MENLFVWMLIFAAVAVGLLATFLIASERELKKNRRELEALTAKLEGNPTVITLDQPIESQQSADALSTELTARNQELRDEISSLSSELEASRRTVEELRTEQQRLIDDQSTIRDLRASNQQLQEEIIDLSSRLLSSDSGLTEPAGQSQQAGDYPSQLQSEIADLRNQLERRQAKERELEEAHQQVANFASRETALKDRQQKLETQIAELERELGAKNEKAQELDGVHTRFAEMERLYHGAQQDNRRLEEEISRWQERLADSEKSRGRLAILHQHFDQLQTKQTALTETHRKFQDDLAAFARLLEMPAHGAADFASPQDLLNAGRSVTESRPNVIGATETEGTSPSDGLQESTPQDDTAEKRKRRFGIFSAVILLVAGGAVAVSYFKPSPDKKASALTTAIATPHKGAGEQPIATAAARSKSAGDIGEQTGLQKPSLSPTQNDTPKKAPPVTAAQRILGTYEITRPTHVYNAPNEGSQLIAIVDPGTHVNVVDGGNGWLEIHSKHGRPPGFIRKDAAARITQN